MFIKNGGMNPMDKVLMSMVDQMKRKKASETYRETRKAKTQYPPSGSGKVNFGNLAPPKKKGFSPGMLQALGQMGQGQFNSPDQMQHMDFNPQGKLDTSQIEDRRTPQQMLMEFMRARGAFDGDGGQERPAPGIAMGNYPVQDESAGVNPMMQILQQYLKGKRRAGL